MIGEWVDVCLLRKLFFDHDQEQKTDREHTWSQDCLHFSTVFLSACRPEIHPALVRFRARAGIPLRQAVEGRNEFYSGKCARLHRQSAGEQRRKAVDSLLLPDEMFVHTSIVVWFI